MTKLTQTQAGQAFQFAVLQAIRAIVGDSNVEVLENASFLKYKEQFQRLDEEQQDLAFSAGHTAMQRIVEFEAYLEDALNAQSSLWVKFRESDIDDFGQRHNDTRDILIGDVNSSWQIGIIAKNRHEALRNSRLSQKIDFGHEWLKIPCSEQYFDEISPIFERLELLRRNRIDWSDLEDKNETVYVPLLAAFRSELLRLDGEFPLRVAPALIHYLLGDYDYYRIIRRDNGAELSVFNFNGTLNASSMRDPTIKLQKLELPKRLIDLDFAQSKGMTSSTTLILNCDGGWEISFRLHNARKEVEPSLKFDIKLLRIPDTLQTFAL